MANTMLLYRNITALSRDKHKGLKLKPVNNAGFSAKTHWVPVAGAEFFQAALHYPLIFVENKTADGASEIVPIALLGLTPGQNEFLGADSQWAAGVYVPAFIRRYPFVLADLGGKDDELTVCFDSACSGFSQTEGEALFAEDGSNSAMLNEAIRFLNGFKAEMERTREFADYLKKHDLLTSKSAEIKNSTGEVFHVQDFLVIEEGKLSTHVDELYKRGFLGWVYAHLISLGNLTDMFARHQHFKQSVPADQAGKTTAAKTTAPKAALKSASAS